MFLLKALLVALEAVRGVFLLEALLIVLKADCQLEFFCFLLFLLLFVLFLVLEALLIVLKTEFLVEMCFSFS